MTQPQKAVARTLDNAIWVMVGLAANGPKIWVAIGVVVWIFRAALVLSWDPRLDDA